VEAAEGKIKNNKKGVHQMLKRMLALLLVLAMVLTVLPLSALATETETTETTNTEAPVETTEAPSETTPPAFVGAEFTLTLQPESHGSVAGKKIVKLMLTSAPVEAYVGSLQFKFTVAEGIEPQWMEGLQINEGVAVWSVGITENDQPKYKVRFKILEAFEKIIK
jgi:hypothetical protein